MIGGLAQSVSALCMAREGRETDTVELRSRIVTDLLVCLIGLAYGAKMADDVITKGVKKVRLMLEFFNFSNSPLFLTQSGLLLAFVGVQQDLAIMVEYHVLCILVLTIFLISFC